MQKKILLTGATDGIGLATAKTLVAQGHTVLLHGRNATKLAAVAADLQALHAGAVESYVADLSSMADVLTLAQAVADQHEQLDVLINNAGILKTPQPITADNLDVRFVVNTLAPYLLTQKLLPLLGTAGRVVNLSSAAQAPVDLAALAGQTPLSDDMAAYSQSKLALTSWSRSMAAAHKDGPMIVAVNPGSLLASKMVKEGFGFAGHDINIGADILVRAALSDEFAGASGQYFDNDAKRFAAPHAEALNEAKAAALLQEIESVLSRLV